jgi:NitT/TauT family transport system substrate-binding protein
MPALVASLEERAAPQIRSGAFESLEAGRDAVCDVSHACHWAVNMASSADRTYMWGHAYMLEFSGLYVPPESPVRTVDDLRGVEIGVGYHSGSHFSTLQFLSPWIAPKDVKTSFIGSTMDRVYKLYDRQIPCANLHDIGRDILEQLGFRKILDCSYMQGFSLSKSISVDDAWKYFRALQRAQIELDAHGQKYKHYLDDMIPERFRGLGLDYRGFSNGKRIVFEEYTREIYESTHRWLESIEIFPEIQAGHRDYSEAVLV